MRVVIFEPNPHGHRFTYVRHIVSALCELPLRITLATSPGAGSSPAFREQLESQRDRFELCDEFPESGAGGRLSTSWRNASELARAVRALEPDHFMIPSASGVLQMLGLRRLAPWFLPMHNIELEAMILSASWAYAPVESSQRWTRCRVWSALTDSSGVRTLHVIDPQLLYAFRKMAPSIARRTVLSPDPVTACPQMTKAEARRRLHLEIDGRILVCSGYLDERKGIDVLVRAFVRARLPDSDRLLLVGEQSPAIREILRCEAAEQVRRKRIISIDGYVTDEQLGLSIAAADLVGVTYRYHAGSASVLIRAAAQGRPVLSTDRGWPGETCRRFRLGRTCDIRNGEALTAALRESMDQAAGFRLSDAAQRFVEFHSVENAKICWARRLRERLGLGAGSSPKTWDWVMETVPPPTSSECSI